MDASRVISRLYQGGRPSPRSRGLDQFHTLVLCAQELQRDVFPRSIEVVFSPMDDAELSPAEAHLAEKTADAVVARWRAGRRLLVTCHQGRNRSGLVTALSLLRLGARPAEAVGLVRAARGSWALSNPSFETYILQGSLRPAGGY